MNTLNTYPLRLRSRKGSVVPAPMPAPFGDRWATGATASTTQHDPVANDGRFRVEDLAALSPCRWLRKPESLRATGGMGSILHARCRHLRAVTDPMLGSSPISPPTLWRRMTNWLTRLTALGNGLEREAFDLRSLHPLVLPLRSYQDNGAVQYGPIRSKSIRWTAEIGIPTSEPSKALDMEVLPFDNNNNNKGSMPSQSASLSARPDAHGTQAPPAQHLNAPRVPAGSSGPHIETFIGSAYPVIPRFTPPISGPNDEVVKEPRRFKCSREQTLALERLYQQCPKPNQATKRDLAHAINLSPTRVNIWFQNRRHRAKKHKEIQEAKMAQILETAGRERMAKIALGAPMALSESSLSDLETPTSATSTTSSGLPLLTTEFNPSSSEASSPSYTSSKEAAAASLARSIAIASAYAPAFSPTGEPIVSEYHAPAASYDGPPPANYPLDAYDPNFYPVSAFSDWGSNYTSSVAYTPTPAGQAEDPFEFDKLSALNSPYPNAAMSGVPPVFHDDYSAFAAAVQMNAMPKTINMSLKSKAMIPNGLVLKNNGATERPSLPRVATCPDLSNIENLSMQQSQRPMHTASETSSPILECGPKFPAPSMERSQSCTERPSLQQEIALRRLRPMPPSLLPNARAQRVLHGKASVPQSPLRSGHGTPLPTPPSDADFATAAMKHKLNRKPSDLCKEHSPEVPDLESDAGYEDVPSKRNLASPPPTPETAGLAQAAGPYKEEGSDQQYASFTKMLEQSSPIVTANGFHDHSNYHQPSVESWIHGHPQHYWAPEHGNPHGPMNFEIPHQSQQVYGMHNNQQ
ncbi:hypothetical protein H072_3160 [Dactylellina haptotyla CBS 200.50]|uniref:Homeobox domain-containing protein n=1 Tax=Dactylellina haptotyla (strain CBS 200.50) TaxID=1284197 RepID=S8BTH7_DACHA|nr:hypothetical protein H072_3160 [Dactylellina haptotyla CBS 200.50]